MAVLFSLVVMRVSGAIAGNPVFGKTNFPPRARACMIVALSVCLHQSTGSGSYRAPGSLVEYAVMLGGELLFGVAFRAKCKMFSRHLQKPILKTEKGRFKGL